MVRSPGTALRGGTNDLVSLKNIYANPVYFQIFSFIFYNFLLFLLMPLLGCDCLAVSVGSGLKCLLV